MQIDGYVQALRDDLVRVAAVGDESTARAAELLAVALESSLGRRLLEALGEAALELSSQLETGASKSGSPAATRSSCSCGTTAPPPSPPPTRRSRPGSPSGSRKASRGGSKPPPPAKESPSTRGSCTRSAPRSRAGAHRGGSPPPPHRLRPELKGVRMFTSSSASEAQAHWVYDDPSGVPDLPEPPSRRRRRSRARGPDAHSRCPVTRASPRPRRRPEMPEHRFHTPGAGRARGQDPGRRHRGRDHRRRRVIRLRRRQREARRADRRSTRGQPARGRS